MSMNVDIIECTHSDELFEQYPGELFEQPVHVELDLRDGQLLTEYDGEPGGGSVPMDVYHGFRRRYDIPVVVGSVANELLHEIAPLAERILDDSDVHWDGSNHVAELGEDARDAEEKILDLTSKDRFSNSDLVIAWPVTEVVDEDLDEYGFNADTSDKRLEEIADDFVEQLAYASDSGVAVCPGLVDHLRTLRAELARDTEVIWSLMEGECPGARAVEPGPVGIDVPESVLVWAEAQASLDNVYLLVTPENEAQADMVNEIAWLRGELPATDVGAIRAELTN